ncbi:hypothetical protein O6H91_10G003400 [Diphasiastrum complanatum]|uniref:Uncharacterized protein n=1 Tax=Diphasiastrum complanatum TaxID=34168 RepID=A0ACC2CDQ7_DIPCM|nr:hypothetical protein O6H91_10G003400 [Diphasiastrum complanatum]
MDDAATGEGWRQSGTTEGSPRHTPRERSGLAKDSIISSLVKSVNHRVEAIAEAHRSRIEAEAQAYLDAATRKAEARAQRREANAERQRMHEESKASEARKCEEQRAEQIVHIAEKTEQERVQPERIRDLLKDFEDTNDLVGQSQLDQQPDEVSRSRDFQKGMQVRTGGHVSTTTCGSKSFKQALEAEPNKQQNGVDSAVLEEFF